MDMALTEEYTDPYQATLENTDVQSYFNPPKQGNTTTFTPHMEQLPPQVAVQSKPQPPTTKEYMDAIMGGFPEPTHPKASQDRIQRIMKTKALGQGLGALGDIFALSQGARVNRRQPDQSISRYRQLFESREDDYLRRMDDHARQQFNLKLQGLQFGIQRGDREQDINFRERSQAFNETLRQDQLNSQEEYRKEQIRVRDDDRKIREAAEKRMDEQFKASHGLNIRQQKFNEDKYTEAERNRAAAEALKQAEALMKANGAGYHLYSQDGKTTVSIGDKGELQKLYTMIVNHHKDSNDLKRRMAMLKPSMGQPGSINEQKIIVSEYWMNTPSVVNFLRNNGKMTDQGSSYGNVWLDNLTSGRPGAPITPTPLAPAAKQQAPVENVFDF